MATAAPAPPTPKRRPRPAAWSAATAQGATPAAVWYWMMELIETT